MVFRSHSSRTLWAALLIAFGLSVPNAVAQTANGKLHPTKDRKVAPHLGLEDSEGKRANLEQYRGKVVVLDFWATWCHGCKEEIPWFAEFSTEIRRRWFEYSRSLVGRGWLEGC
jgi:Thiol-disulfide isomerase and thioredoxins